jgi:hypothetical protein
VVGWLLHLTVLLDTIVSEFVPVQPPLAVVVDVVVDLLDDSTEPILLSPGAGKVTDPVTEHVVGFTTGALAPATPEVTATPATTLTGMAIAAATNSILRIM